MEYQEAMRRLDDRLKVALNSHYKECHAEYYSPLRVFRVQRDVLREALERLEAEAAYESGVEYGG